MTKKNKRILIICSAVLVTLIALFAILYVTNRPAGTAETKNITVEIIGVDGAQKDYSLKTNQEFLRGALEDEKLIAGDEGEYGLYITTVDGYTVDSTKNEWWCVNVNGEMAATGVDEIVVADGEVYSLVLSTY